ncbi:PEST proteolytic signal-containing nuclear protein-like [Dysidea avara]|uniref:PEST proteolytic signal-containing nuclear protein-like n=1 Tax=Dysidea avara TaxID=196820 RepID=UPI003323278F
MSKEEKQKEVKETVTKESEKKSKDDKDSSPADGVKATNTVKLGIKRPGPVTTFGFGKKKKQSGITIQLQSQAKTAETKLVPKLGAAAAAFNDESDEEEEMPLEAKLRMKNIGKGTPTASGPNSFGKTSQGFTNERRVWDMKYIDETRTT